MLHFNPEPPRKNSFPPFFGIEKIFSNQELVDFSQYLKAVNVKDAEVNYNGIKKIVPEYRMSKVGFFSINDDNQDFCGKLANQIASMNAMSYNFDLYGIVEPFQYTIYNSEGNSHYNWHTDTIVNSNVPFRKLSFVFQLSDPSEYEGGNLEINHSGDHTNPIVVPKIKNFLCVFPSFIPHRVTPVTKGQRKTIVGWCCGNTFK